MSKPNGDPLLEFGRRGRLLFAATAFTVVAVIGVLGFIRGTEEFPAILAAICAYVAILLLPVFHSREDVAWFHPLIFTSGFALLQLLRRSSAYINGMVEHAGIPAYSPADLNSLIWRLLALQALAQLAYYLGFVIGPRRSNSVLVSGRTHGTFRKAMVMAIVALLFAYFIRDKGGLQEHMLDLGRGRSRQIEEAQLFGISVIIVNVAMFVVLVLVASARTFAEYTLLAVSLPTLLFMKYTVAGSRSSLVFALVLSLMVRSISTKRIRWAAYTTGAIAAIVAIGALGQLRRGTWKGQEGLSNAIGSMSVDEAFLDGLTELDQRGTMLNPVYAIMARVPDEVPYLLGKSYLSVLTAPIPRALWIDKPRTTGALVGPTFFDSNAGMPPGPIGEALWNFGIPGVLIAYVLFGAFHRYCLVWFTNHPANPVSIVLYAVTMMFLQPDVLSIVLWFQTTLIGYLVCRLLGLVRPAPITGGSAAPGAQRLPV